MAAAPPRARERKRAAAAEMSDEDEGDDAELELECDLRVEQVTLHPTGGGRPSVRMCGPVCLKQSLLEEPRQISACGAPQMPVPARGVATESHIYCSGDLGQSEPRD